MKKRLMVLAGAFLLGLSVYSQSGEKVVKSRLGVYFSDYQTSYTTATDRCKIERVKVDASVRTVEIYLNELFAGQSFSRDKVKGIYRDVKRLLPAPYNAYTIIIYGNGISIENLVTDMSGAPSHLCITPEGTRSRTEEWKKGFYYIALKAGLPILLYGIDYPTKTIRCTQVVVPNGNIDKQMNDIKAYFKDFTGRHPEKFATGLK